MDNDTKHSHGTRINMEHRQDIPTEIRSTEASPKMTTQSDGILAFYGVMI